MMAWLSFDIDLVEAKGVWILMESKKNSITRISRRKQWRCGRVWWFKVWKILLGKDKYCVVLGWALKHNLSEMVGPPTSISEPDVKLVRFRSIDSLWKGFDKN